jgi:hypothetical protein
MFEFKIKEKEYKIPNSWNDITIKNFLDILNLEKQREIYFFDELYIAKMVEVLGDIPEGDMNEMPLDLFGECVENLSFVNDKIVDEPKDKIEIGGEVFVVPTNLSKLSLGEYASIKILTKDKDFGEQILVILAVILRKDGESFKPDFIEERKRLFMGLNYVQVNNIINFFLSGKK